MNLRLKKLSFFNIKNLPGNRASKSHIKTYISTNLPFTLYKRFKEDKKFNDFLIDLILVPLHSSDV